MKTDQNKPEISIAFTPQEMEADGKQDLLTLIQLLIKKDYEIRIGTDGFCTILEAHEADPRYTDGSYQWVDDEHQVVANELMEKYSDYDKMEADGADFE